jgi:hypothetical protein
MVMPRRLRILAALAACAALLALPAVVSAEQQVATAGAVTATLSFDRPDEIQVTNLRVAVTRAGAPVLDSTVTALLPRCEEPFCLPGAGIDRNSITVADLDGDGEPEVIVDGFTGGAHCCVVTAVLGWNGTGYTPFVRDWRDPGYRLHDLNGDGRPEFESADPRFAFAFGSFAESGFPVQVIGYANGAFQDLTPTFLAVVAKDARKWKQAYERRKRGRYSLGVLAAWVADEYRLGEKKKANRFLAKELAAGRLRGTPGTARRGAYVKLLKKRLARWGY